ncbi:MAG: T9SS type A sorting domain-containing protein [Fluviicola sp.]|nr:T9SS type A sorting domain-containing protein [Fluviicola sp.]
MKSIATLLFLFFALNSNAQQTNETILVGAVTRNYIQYLPTGFNSATESLPLIIVLHGLGGTNAQMALAGFNQISDTARFISLYPQGLLNSFSQASWKNGLTGAESLADDIGLFNALIDEMISTHNIDATKVYFTGFSMGSIMSYHMACNMNDRITAIGCMAGTMTNSDLVTCVPTYKTPVIHLHGTADATVPYDGTPVTGLSLVQPTVDFWRNEHTCSSVADSTRLPDTAADGITVDRFVYQNCTPLNSVELWRFNGAGHVYLYQPAYDITESIEIWRFFRQWSKGTVGLAENKGVDFVISPNPSNGHFTIQSEKKSDFNIYTATGKKVQSGVLNLGNTPIDLSELEAGIYIVRIGNYSRKVLLH